MLRRKHSLAPPRELSRQALRPACAAVERRCAKDSAVYRVTCELYAGLERRAREPPIVRSRAADGNARYEPAHAAPRYESTTRGGRAATDCLPHKPLGGGTMLPRAVPALATRTGPPMVPCERRVSLTAQGLLPRHGVHGGPGGVSRPPHSVVFTLRR